MNAELFHEDRSRILLPHTAKVRSNLRLTGEPVVLLMDNCSVHIRESTFRDIAAHRVKVVTLPPHTRNIFQCLDLSLFDILKKRINYKLPLDSDDSTAMFIKCIFHNMKQTLVEDNLRSTFTQIGVRYNIDAPYRLIFDESILRDSPGFISLWRRDYTLGKLSVRRWNARFGWVSQGMRDNWVE
jgi:hypothetical protein